MFCLVNFAVLSSDQQCPFRCLHTPTPSEDCALGAQDRVADFELAKRGHGSGAQQQLAEPSKPHEWQERRLSAVGRWLPSDKFSPPKSRVDGWTCGQRCKK